MRIEASKLHGHSQLFGTFNLPLELVAGIILQPPADRATLDAWTARIAAASGQTDRLLLDNGDELTGSVAGLTEKVVPLESDAGKVEVGLDKVAAIILQPHAGSKSAAERAADAVGVRRWQSPDGHRADRRRYRRGRLKLWRAERN